MLSESTSSALSHAHRVLATPERTALEKTIWSGPAGKRRIAERLAAMLPPHATYVEPFVGAGAVFFAKEPARVEVLNDADREIAKAYRILQRIKPHDIERLRTMTWTGDEQTYYKLLETLPRDRIAWLHRFLYTFHFSFAKQRRTWSPLHRGITATTVDRIERFAPRLAKAVIYNSDYRDVVARHNTEDTAFFLDPPYSGFNAGVGEGIFDEHAFVNVLSTLKGRFLVTYGTRGAFPKLASEAGFTVGRIRTRRNLRTMGPTRLVQLLVSNYEPTQKSLAGLADDGWDVESIERPRMVAVSDALDAHAPSQGAPVVAPNTPLPPDSGGTKAFVTTGPLLKGLDPNDERFVLGVVLEPETVDAQGDIYSAEEVRNAAHGFMSDYRGLGLMHRMRVNDQVTILESYLAPCDYELAGAPIRKGTWLLAVRILSDDLWAQIKEGNLTGFSIGGSARRIPERAREESPEANGTA